MDLKRSPKALSERGQASECKGDAIFRLKKRSKMGISRDFRSQPTDAAEPSRGAYDLLESREVMRQL